MKVALGWHATPEEVERIGAALPSVCSIASLPSASGSDRYQATAEELHEVCANAEVLLTWVLPPEVVERADQLRFVSWMHHGFDRLPSAVLKERGILVANLSGELGILRHVVAEQAWALLLACAKRLIVKDQAVRHARWGPIWEPEYASSEIHDKTIAVIGFGTIGRRVATIGRAFGAKVVAVKKHPEQDVEAADEAHGADALHEVLGRADYVVLCVPLTSETYHLIDDAALRAMRSHAYLINIARGDIVDEGALHRALTEGRLAGFAADVWWDYPLGMPPGQHFPVPSRLGVHRLPNVVCSGDQSSNTLESLDRMITGGADNVRAFVEGDVDRRLIDLDEAF